MFAVVDTILLTAGGSWWIFLLQALLIVVVIWVLLHNTYFRNERNEPTDADVHARIQERLQRFNPEDLVPSEVPNKRTLRPKVLYSKAKKYVKVDDQKCLNLSTMNFLDLIGNKEIEDKAIKAIAKYGVGSCGPRGFYGTFDAHLDLEKRLAEFMGTQDAIVYSYGFSCIASAIPAYAKRGDIIFADERVNFAIQKGLFASRSTVTYFKHNDPDDLEALLMYQQQEDSLAPNKAAQTRKFVIVEGIYLNTGAVLDLPCYMMLRDKYKFRLFIDESISFGTVANGRGITSYYNIQIQDVDMIMATLEYALGSIGGFCCGSKFVIEHQRLSGLGYCFSASQPPLHAVAALKAIDIMESTPQIFTELTATCKAVHTSFKELRGMLLKGWEQSPVKHLYLCSSHVGDDPSDETLHKLSSYCFQHGVAIISPPYIEKEEKYVVTPSLRMCVNRSFQQSEIEKAAQVLQAALDEIVWRYYGIPNEVRQIPEARQQEEGQASQEEEESRLQHEQDDVHKARRRVHFK